MASSPAFCLRANGAANGSCPSSAARSKAFHQCLPAAAGICPLKRSRTILTTAAAQKQQRMQQAAAALAASGLAAALMFSPEPVRAEDMPPSAAADAQAHSLLLPAGSLNLSAPEAPALVADSGSVLDGVKGIVESGLQDLTENSMSAVGGPVTSEVLSASISQAAADSTADQPVEAASHPQHQQQQQQHQNAVWCYAWRAYCDALERSPLVTKVYTGVVGTLLGDLAAQVLAHTSKQTQQQQQAQQQHHHGSSSSSGGKQGFQFDAMRAGRLCLYSAAIGTPMCHAWYNLLESAVMPNIPLAPAAVAAKVALDQLVQTPFGMAIFFSVMKLLEGKPDQVQQELKSKVLPALKANWRLWPAAQLINFTLIPAEQRILFGNVVGICWTCVISKMQQAPSAAAGGAASTAAETAEGAQPHAGASNAPVGEGFDLRRRTSVTA